MRTLALSVAQSFDTKIGGMGVTHSQALVLGGGVLPDATKEGKDASRSNPSVSF